MTELDPDAQRVLDLIRESGRPPYETLEPPVAREFYRKARGVLQPDPPEVAEVRELSISREQGALPLRLYRGLGTEAGAVLPALIFFHGGGWVIGDLDTHDVVCRKLANLAGVAVIAVDYRLAPEHKFPAAVDDCVQATEWIAAHAEALGVDRARLAVGGDSAGGNLAAVVALIARDRGAPRLRFQLLIYPATDLAMDQASHHQVTDGLPLTHATMTWFGDHYLRGPADQRDWRASPLRASDLGGLPPAYVLTVGFDPLRSEGEAYVEALRRAGVPTEHRHFERQMHGFITMGRIIAAAETAIEGAAAALRSALRSGGTG